MVDVEQIVVNLFVAVVLDNLELDEELKKIKQVAYSYNFNSLLVILITSTEFYIFLQYEEKKTWIQEIG